MKLQVLLAFFLLALCLACNHRAEEEAFLGPQIAPEGFAIQEDFRASNSAVNFEQEVQSFKALFSNMVKWEITIKGVKSGATKKITGTSSVLDISNTSWDGDADSIFFFRTGEECTATLSLFNNSIVQQATFKNSAEKKYKGVLVDDFEKDSASQIGFSTTYTDPKDGDISIVLDDSSSSVQGSRSLLMAGLDTDTNYWIGGLQTSALALKGTMGSVDPSSVFFNVSIYGTGAKDAALAIKFFEDDDNSNAYESVNDDAYSYLIKVDWKGWKRVYVPYSNFSDDGTTGNNTQEPNKWTSLNLALVAFTTTQKVSLNADYVLISTGPALPNSELK